MGSENGTSALVTHTLDDVMKRRREVCAEFESHPMATTADATCAIKNGYSWDPNSCDVSQKRGITTDTQLQSLLSERRGRCQVLESSPSPVVADALWNQSSRPLPACPNRRQTTSTNDTTSLQQEVPQQVGVATDGTAGTVGPLDAEVERPMALKLSNWLDALQVPQQPHRTTDQSEKASSATARLLQLMLLKDDNPTSSLHRILAEAFVCKHLAFLNFKEDHIDAAILILLRYHSPAMLPRLVGKAHAPETSMGQGGLGLLDQVGASTVLDLLLGRPYKPDKEDPEGFSSALALLQICDEAVHSGNELILVFVIVAVLADPGLSNPSDSRSAHSLWNSAQRMLSATPRSMLCILAGAEARDQALRLPIGSVAPDEILHHVYERPESEWRLVVVDVRDACSAGLPVCLRLPASADFEDFVASLPAEQALHLCLLADDPLEALKLCLRLSGPHGACRPHVSLAEGGWQAIEELASALRLELLPGTPQCLESDMSDMLETGESAHSFTGTVVEVAEHVASLTSVAASVAFRGAFWATSAHGVKHGHEMCADEFMEV